MWGLVISLLAFKIDLLQPLELAVVYTKFEVLNIKDASLVFLNNRSPLARPWRIMLAKISAYWEK